MEMDGLKDGENLFKGHASLDVHSSCRESRYGKPTLVYCSVTAGFYDRTSQNDDQHLFHQPLLGWKLDVLSRLLHNTSQDQLDCVDLHDHV